MTSPLANDVMNSKLINSIIRRTRLFAYSNQSRHFQFSNISAIMAHNYINQAIDFMGFNEYFPRPNYVQGMRDNSILDSHFPA
jgi:hypothetical protein